MTADELHNLWAISEIKTVTAAEIAYAFNLTPQKATALLTELMDRYLAVGEFGSLRKPGKYHFVKRGQ